MTHNWTGAAGDGNFENPANWDTNMVPRSGTAVITADGGDILFPKCESSWDGPSPDVLTCLENAKRRILASTGRTPLTEYEVEWLNRVDAALAARDYDAPTIVESR